MDWGDVGSPPGMCMVRLHGNLMALERLLARSRTNICLSGGRCNDPTGRFEHLHSVQLFEVLRSFVRGIMTFVNHRFWF